MSSSWSRERTRCAWNEWLSRSASDGVLQHYISFALCECFGVQQGGTGTGLSVVPAPVTDGDAVLKHAVPWLGGGDTFVNTADARVGIMAELAGFPEIFNVPVLPR